MVTNTNKQDISEFFLWSDFSPSPEEGAAGLEPGERIPVPAPAPSTGRVGAGTSGAAGAVWLSLALGWGKNVEMRGPFPSELSWLEWAGRQLGWMVLAVALAAAGE